MAGMGLGRYRLPGSWERRHARVMAPVRVGIGLWLTALTVILLRRGQGEAWALLLAPAAALHFYLAYRLRRVRG